MSLNDTPAGNRLHIGFFGKRNAGKSSLVNAVTGQSLAVVSDIKGTTTDPVYKAMELLPLGPVMIIDTPGIDDTGELGLLRVKKAKQVCNKTDVAVLVIDAAAGITDIEQELILTFQKKQLPYLLVYNKADLLPAYQAADKPIQSGSSLYVSALQRQGIPELKEAIAQLGKSAEEPFPIIRDLIAPKDLIVLVTPIDSAAPKGRLILPQQQTIRDILEGDAISVVVKETELKEALTAFSKKPAMVVTDSQAFAQVSADTPSDILLTSFSILMARHKGLLEDAVRGVKTLDRLTNGDTVLICEGCTHHRQCDDIGTVKLPRWIQKYTGKELHFSFTSGGEFPEDLSPYQLIVHCGGCMLNEREVKYRTACAVEQGVPITNYGTAIAYIHGILKRSLEVFPHLANLL